MQTTNSIATITEDDYPIRYEARKNPGVWVESTHKWANTPAQEAACFRELTPNPAHNDDGSGIYVSIVKCATTREYLADCESYGPNQYRRQNNKLLRAGTLEEAKRLATTWIETIARPWVARELTHQVDYVELTGPDGAIFTGQLYGVASGNLGMPGAFVKLDNPDAYPGAVRRGGVVWVTQKNIRRLPHID